MHIALLLPNLRVGGVEQIRLTLAQEFSNMGHQVTFVLRRAEGALLPAAVSRYPVIELGASNVRSTLLPLRRWLAANRPDVVIAGIWPLTCVAILAAFGLNIKVIISDHNPLSKQYAAKGMLHRLVLRASVSALYPLAYARIGVSKVVARDIEKLGRLKRNSVSVIYNPLRANIAQPPSDLTKHSSIIWKDSSRLKILSVGSLKSQKNYALLIRAFCSISEEFNAELSIVGEGEQRSILEELVQNLGASDRVSLPGQRNDINEFYKNADLFVLTSDYEGFGNVIVEALSYGLTVVSTDCEGGPREILGDNQFGYLVSVGNVTELSNAMKKALVHPIDKRVLLQRASEFSPEVASSKYIELIQGKNR
jgi:glycosyltransferase involved in cell wall biosynthesis